MQVFDQFYLPAIKSERIEHFALFTLSDQAEQDDHCANIYHKSLLYLISNALEERMRSPWRKDGWPILGMEKFVRRNEALMRLIDTNKIDWIIAPNNEPAGSVNQSRASCHGSFDDDQATVRATLSRILGNGTPKQQFVFDHSVSALRDRRQAVLR